MNGRLWIPVLSAVMLLACAGTGPDNEAVFSSELAPSVAPAIPSALLPQAIGAPPDSYRGLDPLEVSVLSSEVIVRASYVSRQASVAHVTHPPPYSYDNWAALLTFRFRVHEYLKGSGPNEVYGIVYIDYFETEAGAQAAMAAMSDVHDSRWDDREAIVFLSTDLIADIDHHELSAGQYWFGAMHEVTQELGTADAYTVASRHRKLWLPEAASSGLPSSARSSGEKFYLLEAPPTSAGGSSTGDSSFSSSRSSPSTPTIGLRSLKSRISNVEAEANVGGTPEYHTCVEMSYIYEARVQYQISLRGQPPLVRFSTAIESGLPAGTPVHDEPGSGRSMDKISAARFEGPDKDLFRFANVDFSTATTPHYEVRFTHRGVTARPLPAGAYVVYPNLIWYGGVVCDRRPENARRYWMLSVTAASTHPNMIHEAFFDPVAIGAAVGADGTNGVLKPAAFTVGGASATMQSLKWEDGAVTMTLSPTASLADYAIDFIDVNGTTTLSLTPDNASTTALTWTVPDKPWADGDLLMLRMRRFVSSDATLSGLTLTGIDLAFSPDTTTYAATVAATTTQTTVTPTTNHGSATYVVKLAGVVDLDGTIDLAVGDNVITVVVTAEDTTTNNTYTVTVTRAVPSSPVTVTLIPRVDILTFFDIDIQWNYSGTCENYFVAITTDTEYMIRSLGFHPPQASSHYVQGGWLYDSVPDFWVVVQCRGSGDSQEVGRASLRAAHPDNN